MIVAGYELGQRIGPAADSNINGLNVIVATVVFSKLLDFDGQQTARALSLAAAQAATPTEMHSRTMLESLNYLYGLKVMNAITIFRIVALGLDNPATAANGSRSFKSTSRSWR